MQGERLFSDPSTDLAAHVAAVLDVVPIIEHARFVCRTLGINPLLPPDFGPRHAHEVEVLLNLLACGEHRDDTPDARITLTLTRSGLASFLDRPDLGDEVPFSTVNPGVFPFFGELVDVGPVEIEVLHLRLASDAEVLRRQLAGGSGDDWHVAYDATPSTQRILRLLRRAKSA